MESTEKFVSDIQLVELFSGALGLSWLRKDRRHERVVPFLRLGGKILYLPSRVREVLLLTERGGTARTA